MHHIHICIQCWSFIWFSLFSFFCIFTLALGSGGRWTQWMDWSTCTTECIQIRRRTCIDVNYDSITTSPAVSKLSMDGNEKSACTGRDLQTRDCRGGYCTIGKEGKYPHPNLYIVAFPLATKHFSGISMNHFSPLLFEYRCICATDENNDYGYVDAHSLRTKRFNEVYENYYKLWIACVGGCRTRKTSTEMNERNCCGERTVFFWWENHDENFHMNENDGKTNAFQKTHRKRRARAHTLDFQFYIIVSTVIYSETHSTRLYRT